LVVGAAERLGAASIDELDAIGERLLSAQSLVEALGPQELRRSEDQRAMSRFATAVCSNAGGWRASSGIRSSRAVARGWECDSSAIARQRSTWLSR
jgi:hypothetical protein